MLENSTGSRLCVAKVWDDLKRAENYQIDPGCHHISNHGGRLLSGDEQSIRVSRGAALKELACPHHGAPGIFTDISKPMAAANKRSLYSRMVAFNSLFVNFLIVQYSILYLQYLLDKDIILRGITLLEIRNLQNCIQIRKKTFLLSLIFPTPSYF